MNYISKLSVALALTLAGTCAQAALQATAGPYRIALETEPRVVALGQTKLKFRIADASGKTLEGLDVRVIARMPGMSMGERETAARAVSGGTYEAFQPISMAGAWEVGIRIKGPLGEGSAAIPMQTGQDTGGGAGGGFSIWMIAPWLVGLFGLAYVVFRARAQGQKFDAKAVLNRAVLGGLLLLAVLIWGAVWAVNNLRRKGAMTPLEAQVMEMNTPAPPGTTPATLAILEFGEVVESVAYSGQAVGFVEQEVVPRVTGTIVAMPVYVGDRVAKGQVVARLDTSQLDPEVAEKAAMTDVATRGMDVASSDYRAAIQEVAEARADLSARESAVEEASAMEIAARQERIALGEAVTVAEAKVEDAKAEIQSAEKNLDFWNAELARARELYEKGVIARANRQRTEAESARAQTEAHHAHQGLRQAQAELGSAKASLAKAEAMVAAAGKRVGQARADVLAARAAIRTKEAAAEARRKSIGQSQAEIARARAGYRSASTMRGYTELRAEIDGIVSERTISPGTVVGPGQTVLRIAQVAPIRLQANVAQQDLDRIRVGTPVEIDGGAERSQPLRARVASIGPSVDPVSRTAKVEVVHENRDRRFAPGQYVAMRFQVGAATRGLRVPMAALRPSLDPDRFDGSVWVATPQSEKGQFSVRRIEVEIAAQDGKVAAVRSPELKEGLQVVVQGGATLREGDIVSAAVEAPDSKGPIVRVSAQGFDPPTIEVEAGVATTITFLRVSEEGCGTEVVFPDLGINQPLPLNKPTPVAIHPNAPGTFSFACGMDMLRGKVVAR